MIGREPCDILKLMLSGAKLARPKDKVYIQDIVTAQKMFGCRNNQKRQKR